MVEKLVRCKKCKSKLRMNNPHYDKITNKTWFECTGCYREVEKAW